MNKKGYTLVEIIAVIALIAVICGLFVLNFSRKNNNQLEENYYEILEVNKNASPEIIEKAYKTLVKKYHPDLQRD